MKKVLTVKGSGCVALGHPGRVRDDWLLNEHEGSGADTAFGPLRRHGLAAWLEVLLQTMVAADESAPRVPLRIWPAGTRADVTLR